MRECRKCKDAIPRSKVIEGKTRNLSSRKFCLKCSPFGKHNTKPDIDKETVRPKDYKDWSDKDKKNHSKKTYELQKQRRFDRKKKYVLLKGGCCMKCGYDKNLSVLNFHHREPEEKNFSLSSRELGMYSEDRLLDELDKCDLLCSNCHAELHHPHFEDWK